MPRGRDAAAADPVAFFGPTHAARLGADGLMVLPPMVYPSDRLETIAHFRAVAAATSARPTSTTRVP